MQLHTHIQKKRKTVLPTLALICVLLIACFALAKVVLTMHDRYVESGERRARIEEDYALLAERTEVIRAEVASFETPEGKEAVVRESFNVAKEGERVAIILENQVEEAVPEEVPWYRKLWNKVKFWE